jgi:hypothetical protein
MLVWPRRDLAECEEDTDSSGAEPLDERDRMPLDPVNPWFLRVCCPRDENPR